MSPRSCFIYCIVYGLIPLFLLNWPEVFELVSPGDMDHTIDELKRLGMVNITGEKATISLIGENIRTSRDFASLVFRNLEDVNICMVAQGASPISMTFVVDEFDVSSVIARLHEAFFKYLDPDIFD